MKKFLINHFIRKIGFPMIKCLSCLLLSSSIVWGNTGTDDIGTYFMAMGRKHYTSRKSVSLPSSHVDLPTPAAVITAVSPPALLERRPSISTGTQFEEAGKKTVSTETDITPTKSIGLDTNLLISMADMSIQVI